MNDLTEETMTDRSKFTGWKKVFCEDGNEVVLFLWLDEDNAIKKPTETDYGIAKEVEVLAIYDMWGYRTALKSARSHFNKDFKYEVGKTYAPEKGIWYWPTFKQARSYWVNAEEVKDDRYSALAAK